VTPAERKQLYAWSIWRPPSWYVDHPNSDRAAERLIVKLAVAPLLSEHLIGYVTTPSPCTGLTIRQLQVLGGMAGGLRIVAIADLLGIRPNSVSTHLKCVYRKLGVGCATEAVAVAMRNGWL